MWALVIGGIVLGSMLAALEAALAALGDVRISALADGKGPYADTAARVVRDLDRINTRLLAGRVLCVSMAAALAVQLAHARGGLAEAMFAAGLVALVYGVSTSVLRTVARQRAGRWVLRALRWLRPLELLMVPLAVPLEWLSRVVERLVPKAGAADPERITELGLERMIEEGREAGAIEADQADLLHSVLEFKNTLAHEIMVPRTQMAAVEITKPLAEVVELIVEQGHSRYPVFRGTVDQVVGVLYAKDLFRILDEGGSVEEVALASVIRDGVFFVSEVQKIETMLREMQARRIHLAVVVDEFGGTAGLVTLEDIIEEIVGEIRDEYDADEGQVVDLGGGRWLVDAGISIYDLEEQIGVRLHIEDRDYDSLGGMVVDLAGHVPSVGESVLASTFRLTVRDADQRHVRRVELARRDDGAVQ